MPTAFQRKAQCAHWTRPSLLWLEVFEPVQAWDPWYSERFAQPVPLILNRTPLWKGLLGDSCTFPVPRGDVERGRQWSDSGWITNQAHEAGRDSGLATANPLGTLSWDLRMANWREGVSGSRQVSLWSVHATTRGGREEVYNSMTLAFESSPRRSPPYSLCKYFCTSPPGYEVDLKSELNRPPSWFPARRWGLVVLEIHGRRCDNTHSPELEESHA